MRRGRASWTSKLSSAELQAVHDWVDSSKNYQAADIYRELNLQRYCSGRSFRDYVRQRRDENQDRAPVEEGALPPSSFSQLQLERMIRDTIGKALLTGEVPAYALPKILSSLASMGQLELRREIYADARQKLRDAVQQKTEGGAKTLTMGEVVEMVDAVMRGE